MEIRIPPDLSADDLEDFPDEGFRYELHEGNLVITSPAKQWHFRVILRLVSYFDNAGLHAGGEVDIKFDRHDVRTPDAAVFHDPVDLNAAFFAPSEIAIAVEVVSPSSEIEDRVTKPWIYAHAGIPEYWRVEQIGDTEDATIYRFVLDQAQDGEPTYKQVGMTTLSELEQDAG